MVSEAKARRQAIAKDENCIGRLDSYSRLLGCAEEILRYARREIRNKHLPDEFKSKHHNDLGTIFFDLKSLRSEAESLALEIAEDKVRLNQDKADEEEEK